ncbi:MAG: hypothetical protein LBT24_04810 [Tannerella sp.]|jgi:hypothetical protein|nr:hypothetical protein [Tannerella sp.]
MIIKSFFKVALMGLMLATASMGFAQEAKTADELKAERKEFQAEMKSKEAQKRAEKLAKLEQQGQPAACNVSSVDMLATSSSALLNTVQETNKLLDNYKNDVIDNGDGNIDITTEKAKLEDYIKLSLTLAEASARVAVETQKLQSIKDEIKSLAPTQAMPATKSVNYSTDALKISSEELSLQAKLVKNLIETIKSSNNL